MVRIEHFLHVIWVPFLVEMMQSYFYKWMQYKIANLFNGCFLYSTFCIINISQTNVTLKNSVTSFTDADMKILIWKKKNISYFYNYVGPRIPHELSFSMYIMITARKCNPNPKSVFKGFKFHCIFMYYIYYLYISA